MSHEPECNLLMTDEWGRLMYPILWPLETNPPKGIPGCNCHKIRAAYQRGREDAAETVRIAAYKLLIENVVKGITWEQMADMAIAAARGDNK